MQRESQSTRLIATGDMKLILGAGLFQLFNALQDIPVIRVDLRYIKDFRLFPQNGLYCTKSKV